MNAGLSQQRRRRAAVAFCLGERPLPEGGHSLDWQALGHLPAWCARGAADRRALQLTAGAVALRMAVRHCLHGPTLMALFELIGASRLRALRTRPYRAGAADTPSLTGNGELEPLLLGHGARILLQSVDADRRGSPDVHTLLAHDSPTLDTLDLTASADNDHAIGYRIAMGLVAGPAMGMSSDVTRVPSDYGARERPVSTLAPATPSAPEKQA